MPVRGKVFCICIYLHRESGYRFIYSIGPEHITKGSKKQRGVSPDILAIANKAPVIIPLFPVLRTMYKVVFHCGIPRAREASLIDPGTSLSDSSVVLVTRGIINIERATHLRSQRSF